MSSAQTTGTDPNVDNPAAPGADADAAAAADPMTLYFAPGACSRVTIVALEEAGLPYVLRRVSLMEGQQRTPGYLALNPKGKVPLLLTPHGPMSENVAIATWLDAVAPGAALLPPAEPAFERAQALGWLAWSATTLHPQVYRLRMTPRIHPDAATHDAIRTAAGSEMVQQLDAAERTLADGRPWLGGDRWSIADAHVTWAVDRARASGVALDAVPNVAALLARQMERPAWQRAVDRESDAAS